MNLPENGTAGRVGANGVELQYYRTGDGPPLVMVHGLYDNGRCFGSLADDLAEHYGVVTYDARGHGGSDAPETGYDIENRVADLVSLVNELNLDNPILFGHSMGGATVAWAAATHSDLPRALVCEDPEWMLDAPDIGPDERARMVRETLRDRGRRSVEEEVAANYTDIDPEWARRHAVASAECSPHIAAIAREGYPSPLRDMFDSIACPTLVLCSDADTERRVRDLDAADSLSKGRLVHVPDAGHYVFHNEYDAAYAELRPFLRRV